MLRGTCLLNLLQQDTTILRQLGPRPLEARLPVGLSANGTADGWRKVPANELPIFKMQLALNVTLRRWLGAGASFSEHCLGQNCFILVQEASRVWNASSDDYEYTVPSTDMADRESQKLHYL